MTISRFKILARKVSEYYCYTDDDKKDLWEAYKLNQVGILGALGEQSASIDVEVAIKGKKSVTGFGCF